MDDITCNVCQITMHRSMYDEHMRLHQTHQTQQTMPTYDIFGSVLDFSALLLELNRRNHQVSTDTFPPRSIPQPPTAPFYPNRNIFNTDVNNSHSLSSAQTPHGISHLHLQYSTANTASTQQTANFLHNFDTITTNNWPHTSNSDIPHYTYTQSTTTPEYWETRLVSPFLDIGAFALEMLSTIDDSEYYNNYEANLRLSERVGVVEVGIENIDAVSTIIQKEEVNPDDVCTICLDKIIDNCDNICVRQLICGHRYCDDCISQWLIKSKKCPVCNIDLEDKLNEDEQ
jgi:hypothetical protein